MTTQNQNTVKLVISGACFHPECCLGLSPGDKSIMTGSYLFCSEDCLQSFSHRPEGKWIKATGGEV